jgi:hypothetical protein
MKVDEVKQLLLDNMNIASQKKKGPGAPLKRRPEPYLMPSTQDNLILREGFLKFMNWRSPNRIQQKLKLT